MTFVASFINNNISFSCQLTAASDKKAAGEGNHGF